MKMPFETLSLAKPQNLEEAFEHCARKHKAKGVQAVRIRGGLITDTFSHGWATIGSDPMTTKHLVRVASVSKIALALLALRLQEDRKLLLSDPVSRYWDCRIRNPWYPEIPIDFYSLLTHTSSFAEASLETVHTHRQVRDWLSRPEGYRHVRPGDIRAWKYSNFAFCVLGLTLERAAGQTLDDMLQACFFDPLHIRAGFHAGDLALPYPLATIYRPSGEIGRSVEDQRGLHAAPPGEDGITFAGGLVISSEDMGKLICMLVGGGTVMGHSLLTSRSIDLLHRCLQTQARPGRHQALALKYLPKAYGRNGIYYLAGKAYGITSCISYDLASGDGAVVFSSGASSRYNGNKIDYICRDINKAFYTSACKDR